MDLWHGVGIEMLKGRTAILGGWFVGLARGCFGILGPNGETSNFTPSQRSSRYFVHYQTLDSSDDRSSF